MRRLKIVSLFPIAFIALGSDALAKSPYHEECLKAADYEGCIKVLTNGVSTSDGDALTKLRSTMKQVASRLSSGTSLNDSATTFRPVIDAHAVIPPEQQDSLAYQSASMAIELFDDTRAIWQQRIRGLSYTSALGYFQTQPACRLYENMVALAAAKTGNPQAFYWGWESKGLFGATCSWLTPPERPVYRFTIAVLNEGATNPEDIANYAAQLKEARRLAELGPWQRYLEQNPGMAAWVKANPSLGEKKRKEYINENGSDPIAMPTLPSSLGNLRGTKVEKYL